MALAGRVAGFEVTLWGRNADRVEATRALGLEATTDLTAAVAEADLIILAVPVGVMGMLADQLKKEINRHALVTDVGSVKVLPHEMAGEYGIPFIGSHPMAGSEQTGIAAARADLFQGAACALTNDQGRSESEVKALMEFWQALGCEVSLMGAADHDRAVARISHLPHAMAVATASAGLRLPGDGFLAAGGFRDTTRVASGDPAMWAEIMVENRAALTSALEDAQNEIREMLDHLAKADKKGLQKYLEEVKVRKENPDAFL
ncbi:MAG: prephenate dehydrogenase [Akkermansiaceae bacterium]